MTKESKVTFTMLIIGGLIPFVIYKYPRTTYAIICDLFDYTPPDELSSLSVTPDGKLFEGIQKLMRQEKHEIILKL